MSARRARLVALFATLATLLPLYWLLHASAVPDAQVFETRTLPWPSTALNFRLAFFEHGAWEILLRAATIALSVTLVVVPCAAAAAYSLARLRGRGLLLAVFAFAVAAFIPPVALLPALSSVGLAPRHSGVSLLLPYLGMTLPMAVLLLIAFFRRLPANLEAAAFLDGAGPTRFLLDILLPLSAPTVGVVATLVFLLCWGEMLLSTPADGGAAGTLTAALALAHPPGSPRWGEAIALAVIATLPAVGAAVALRRPILSGVHTLLDAAAQTRK